MKLIELLCLTLKRLGTQGKKMRIKGQGLPKEVLKEEKARKHSNL